MTHLFYKCLQLVQGVIMLISITIIPLFNFEKNIWYVFLFLGTSKLVFPQCLPFTLFPFRENNGEKKTLQLTSINFVYMRLLDLQRIARIAMAHCSREAMPNAERRMTLKFSDHG